jgi:predicted amidohydrolase
MTRNIRVAAAQLGPIQKADAREAVVARMLALMRQAEGCDLIVYPELALTTFFPRWYHAERGEADSWFEREMPGPATRPLFAAARGAGMAMTSATPSSRRTGIISIPRSSSTRAARSSASIARSICPP